MDSFSDIRYTVQKAEAFCALGPVATPVQKAARFFIDVKAAPKRSTHSVVALIDVGTRGNALVIPVSITAERSVDGVRMDVNAISSAYERNVSALVKEAVAQFNAGDNSVFYVKKKPQTF